MRYQRPFPNVIPHAKVGCSRVTHPSATKLSSSKLSNNSVRLECVMHAASVHPEPGSNSRCFVLNHPLECSNLIELFSSFFYFCLSSILFQNLTRYSSFALYSFLTPLSVSRFVLAFISCCSIFNDRFRCPSKYTALLVYHKPLRFVKYFFRFFKTFFRTPSPRRVRDLVILPYLFCFVKRFLKSFFKNFKTFFKSHQW